ncbi:MAG: methyltransferase domain-containing protein [Chloroflexota bacterium]
MLEAEVIEGLEEFTAAEIEALFGEAATIQARPKGAVRFTFRGNLARLESLQTVQAVYLVVCHAIPRPKALLGDQHLRAVVNQISVVKALNERKNPLKTLFISAAGSDSRVMERIRQTLASAAQLTPADDKGDLWIRIRPALEGNGWETLVRLTARPLATREWRICNYEGALNATVAQVMARLAAAKPGDRSINLLCGSGSILIEYAAVYNSSYLIGIDYSAEVLHCARKNIDKAQLDNVIRLLQADARHLPFPDNSFDVLLADLPFGQRVGSHRENLELYPQLLDEASRIAAPRARFIAITHEVNLFERLVRHHNVWESVRTIRITLRGLHPRIYVLRRRS